MLTVDEVVDDRAAVPGLQPDLHPPDDVALHALPLFHVAAQHCMLTPYASLGATNVVLDGPEPGALIRSYEAGSPTSLLLRLRSRRPPLPSTTTAPDLRGRGPSSG